MFIFSQFNFPDPKPRVSEGDWRVPREVGGRSSCCPEAKGKQEGDFPGGEREPRLIGEGPRVESCGPSHQGFCVTLSQSFAFPFGLRFLYFKKGFVFFVIHDP